MAAHTVARGEVGVHLQLTAGTVEIVIFDDTVGTVEIVARDGAAEVWYSIDGSDPAPGSASSYCIPAGMTGVDERRTAGLRPSLVKLLATGAAAVSVQRDVGR